MPVKLLGDKRLSMGARLMLVILWGRKPTATTRRVDVSKAALRVTMDVTQNTLNRYTREVTRTGWARYDAGSWWLSEESEAEAA